MTQGLLIADADAELRRIYDRMSLVVGYPVETAADGLECWSKVRARPPAALVIDSAIPWGGSEGVLACLRESSREIALPAIFVTGDEPPRVLAERFGVPATHCYQKPFWLTTLLESVRVVIRAGR